jgi:hypothetical protein
MFWETGEPAAPTAREAARYDFAVPMSLELGNGLLRASDRVDAFLVDLSAGGAALIVPVDERLRTKKRYRVHIDDHSGIIEVRNITPLVDDQIRLGIAFKGLGLELQELVVDSLATARAQTSRLADTG